MDVTTACTLSAASRYIVGRSVDSDVSLLSTVFHLDFCWFQEEHHTKLSNDFWYQPLSLRRSSPVPRFAVSTPECQKQMTKHAKTLRHLTQASANRPSFSSLMSTLPPSTVITALMLSNRHKNTLCGVPTYIFLNFVAIASSAANIQLAPVAMFFAEKHTVLTFTTFHVLVDRAP